VPIKDNAEQVAPRAKRSISASSMASRPSVLANQLGSPARKPPPTIKKYFDGFRAIRAYIIRPDRFLAGPTAMSRRCSAKWSITPPDIKGLQRLAPSFTIVPRSMPACKARAADIIRRAMNPDRRMRSLAKASGADAAASP